jgi:hypothetical protein
MAVIFDNSTRMSSPGFFGERKLPQVLTAAQPKPA